MNKEYTVFDASGQVVRTGQCHEEDFDLQAMNPGERVEEGIVKLEKSRPVLHWSEKRRRAYPSAGVLGDALYWQSKGNNEPMEAYLAACEAVKLAIPKEE